MLQIAPAAKDLICRLMCDVDERLGSNGVDEIKVRACLCVSACVCMCEVCVHECLHDVGVMWMNAWGLMEWMRLIKVRARMHVVCL